MLSRDTHPIIHRYRLWEAALSLYNNSSGVLGIPSNGYTYGKERPARSPPILSRDTRLRECLGTAGAFWFSYHRILSIAAFNLMHSPGDSEKLYTLLHGTAAGRPRMNPVRNDVSNGMNASPERTPSLSRDEPARREGLPAGRQAVGIYRLVDLSRRLDRDKNTLLRWEAEGRIPPARRDSRGWRYYTQEDLDGIIRLVGERLSRAGGRMPRQNTSVAMPASLELARDARESGSPRGIEESPVACASSDIREIEERMEKEVGDVDKRILPTPRHVVY